MEERGIMKMNIDLDNDFNKVVAIKVVGVAAAATPWTTCATAG